jgi:hypothetical protein
MRSAYCRQEVHVTVLALVLGAAILLTLMVVHSYSGRDATPHKRRARAAHGTDGGDAAWAFSGSDGGASDCGAGDAGGGCGDGGGGGGGD